MTGQSGIRRSWFLLAMLGLIGYLSLGIIDSKHPHKRLVASGDSPTPSGDDGLYANEEDRNRAVRYNRKREQLILVGMAWTGLLSFLAIVTGFSARLRDRAEAVAPARLGPAIPYTLVTTLLSTLASLPLSYYSDFMVEHQYGLSKQTRRAWFADEAKGLGLNLVLSLPLVQGVYWIMSRYPRRWWAILSALTVPLTVILANLAPVLIMPIFNKFESLKDQALAERIKALAAAQGVTVSDVLQMDMSRRTSKANAMFTGIGNTKRIILGDTLLDEFTLDEVEIVIAHELGHQIHRDIWKLIGLGALTTTLLAYMVHRLTDPVVRRFGARFGLDPVRGAEDVAALPLLSLLLGVVSLALTPIQNAISRNLIERPADRYALELTGKHEAFIGAMEKLGRMNLADPDPSLLVKYLLYSHPPISERVDYARSESSR